MKTYPIKRPDGSLHAFEIDNAFISIWTIRRILGSIDGLSSLSRQSRSDDLLTFVFQGAQWIVLEPWGDSSRYWIGPANAENHSFEVGPIHNTFVSYKSPYHPGLAFTINCFALFIYAFALVGPLLPSHGLPSLWILLAFVGGPSVAILVASRMCQSLEARVFCYLEIASVVGMSFHMYLKLARMIGSQHLN